MYLTALTPVMLAFTVWKLPTMPPPLLKVASSEVAWPAKFAGLRSTSGEAMNRKPPAFVLAW